MAKEFFLTKWIRGWRLDKAFDKVKDWAEDVVPKVIEVVNNVKEYDDANGTIIDYFAKVIPGTWTEDLIAKFRASLIKNLPLVVDFTECLKTDTIEEATVCLTKKLQSIPNLNVRAQRIANLAALIAKDFEDDGKLDINELSIIIKEMYEED